MTAYRRGAGCVLRRTFAALLILLLLSGCSAPSAPDRETKTELSLPTLATVSHASEEEQLLSNRPLRNMSFLQLYEEKALLFLSANAYAENCTVLVTEYRMENGRPVMTGQYQRFSSEDGDCLYDAGGGRTLAFTLSGGWSVTLTDGSAVSWADAYFYSLPAAEEGDTSFSVSYGDRVFVRCAADEHYVYEFRIYEFS